MSGTRAAVAACAAGLLLAGACDRAPETPDEPSVTAPEQPTPEPQPGPERGAEEPVEVITSVVAAGLEVPWDVTFTDDGRTFVTERDSGVLSELVDGQRREVATLTVDPTGEGGLLGVAASPAFPSDETLFVYATTSRDNRILRLRLGQAPEPLLTGIPSGRVHNGGRLAFGPDGMLYATTGDAGQPALSPDPGSLAGKILRLTADGDVPDDNPTPGSPVYARGLRNAQGLAWDAEGTLVVTELGPDVDDAVLRVAPGSDQGWNARSAGAGAGGRDFPEPLTVQQPPEASWSGAGFLRDGAIPQWEGDLFVAALRGQRLWRFPPDTADAEQLLVGELGRLRHVTKAPDGSLWILTSNRDGRGRPAADDDRIIRLGPPP
ncbi:MAG TPA: PQQ-dependent sugar dehydrogenase [Egibacteraceae bacterium]|nr:PQQ-dependent sugar dehydrogenase [Egibacteraceae bacterium]